MELAWDYISEFRVYWVEIAIVGFLLMLERGASRWAPFYGPWARRKNRGTIVALSIFTISVLVLGFLAWRDEHRKNIDSIASVIGQPGIVYNVNGINAITAYLMIQNYGQSIAREASWEVGVNVLDLVAGDGPFAGLGEPQLRQGPTVIPPGEGIARHPEAQWPSNAGERAEMVAAIKKREKGIFVFGRITYIDTLGTPWASGFCRIYAGPNTLPYPDQDGTPRELYPDQEYVPCPNPELNHGPRKIPKS